MNLGGADVSFFLCFVLGTTRFRADLIFFSFSNSFSNCLLEGRKGGRRREVV